MSHQVTYFDNRGIIFARVTPGWREYRWDPEARRWIDLHSSRPVARWQHEMLPYLDDLEQLPEGVEPFRDFPST